MIKKLAVLIIGGLIVWYVQNHFKDVPNATYFVSDATEIPGAMGKTEYTQEVSVINAGRNPVKEISVKVPRQISTYQLSKHSNQIKEAIYREDNRFELVYSELSAGQKFRLLLRYEGIIPIEKGWITVSHYDGIAQVQDKQLPQTNYNLLWLAYVLGIATYIFWDVRKFKRDFFIKYTDGDKLFRDTKPWYAMSSEWSEMQLEAIKKSLTQYIYGSVEQTPSYQLLNRTKPLLMLESHWADLLRQAINLLEVKLSNEVFRYTNKGKLIDFFSIKKPENFPLSLWERFQESLAEQYETKLFTKYINESELAKIIENDSKDLNGIPDVLVKKFRELAQSIYSKKIIENAFSSRFSVSSIIANSRFDILTAEQATLAKEKIHKIARMHEMPTGWRLYELEAFISKGKPEWMEEAEFNSVTKFVKDANSLSENIATYREKNNKLEAEKIELEIDQEHVLSQLNLIDNVLSDPSSVEKIEKYEQIFAPGNQKNLELVASILRKTQLQK